MARVFWDTNLFIYLLEDHAVFGGEVIELRRRMLARGDRLFTSTFTVGEILVKPIEVQAREVLDRYRSLFSSSALTVVPFDMAAAEHYAAIRQDRSIRPPDAIQLACAAAARIDLFLTNDDHLSRKDIHGIQFITSLRRSPL